MAIQLVSTNLNILGDQGRFESDPSTWGQISFAGTLSRSAIIQTEGIFSGVNTISTPTPILFNALFSAQASAHLAGKKYIAKAKVFVPTGFLPAAGASAISISQYIEFGVFGSPSPTLNVISSVTRTVTEATNTWVEIEMRCEVLFEGTAPLQFQITIPNPLTVGGKLHCDEFYIFEYIGVAEPCTLQINAGGTTVTNETAPAANDGTINVAITGGTGPFEYSKDNGTNWQPSALFTGLAPGVYTMVVREIARISCNATQSFAVNSAVLNFDFTTIVTNETVSGSADGQIAITVTGTVAPFTFSKNGGVTYQSGNVFTGLAAGVYTIVVKDAGNIIRARNVTVLPGILLFERIWHSGNYITTQRQAPPGWEVNPNYRLYCEVRVEEQTGSGVYVPTLITHLTPDGNDSATFQTREALRGFLKARPVVSDQIIRLTDRIKSFKFYTGSVQGTSDVPGLLTDSVPHLALMGGISKRKYNDDFFLTLPTTKKLMSWAPPEKAVDPTQPDYVNYLVFTPSVNTLQLQITATYTDATQATAVTRSLAGAGYGQLYQLPVGPQNSGVQGITPAKTVSRYTVRLLDQAGTVISEERTFVLDAVSHPRKKVLMFLNSLGSFETLRLTGVTETQTDMSREEIVRYMPLVYDAQEGERITHRATLRDSGSYGTGYLTGEYAAAWLSYLKDLLRSPRVYLMEGSALRLVTINGGSFAMPGDQNYERALRMTLTDSFEEEYYTP